MMKKKWILFLLLTLLFQGVSSAAQLSCPSSLSVEQIAQSLIKLELSGIQLEESTCLDQEKFPHLLVEGDFSQEVAPEVVGYINEMKDVTLSDVKEIDPDVHLYEATFKMKAELVRGGFADVQEKVRFMLYKDSEAQKSFGCAGVIEHTQKVYLLKNCQIKN